MEILKFIIVLIHISNTTLFIVYKKFINQIIELPGDRLLTSFFDIYSTKEPYNDQPTKIKNELDTSPEQKQLIYLKEKDLIIGIAITGNNFEGGLDIINGTTLEVVKSVEEYTLAITLEILFQ